MFRCGRKCDLPISALTIFAMWIVNGARAKPWKARREALKLTEAIIKASARLIRKHDTIPENVHSLRWGSKCAGARGSRDFRRRRFFSSPTAEDISRRICQRRFLPFDMIRVSRVWNALLGRAIPGRGRRVRALWPARRGLKGERRAYRGTGRTPPRFSGYSMKYSTRPRATSSLLL